MAHVHTRSSLMSASRSRQARSGGGGGSDDQDSSEDSDELHDPDGHDDLYMHLLARLGGLLGPGRPDGFVDALVKVFDNYITKQNDQVARL